MGVEYTYATLCNYISYMDGMGIFVFVDGETATARSEQPPLRYRHRLADHFVRLSRIA